MIKYIISPKRISNVKKYEKRDLSVLIKMHEIHDYDCKKKNIYIVKNDAILYMNDIFNNACKFNHVEILEWLKKSKWTFHDYKILDGIDEDCVKKIFKNYSFYVHSAYKRYFKCIKFKVKNKYIKGYQKN